MAREKVWAHLSPNSNSTEKKLTNLQIYQEDVKSGHLSQATKDKRIILALLK